MRSTCRIKKNFNIFIVYKIRFQTSICFQIRLTYYFLSINYYIIERKFIKEGIVILVK